MSNFNEEELRKIGEMVNKSFKEKENKDVPKSAPEEKEELKKEIEEINSPLKALEFIEKLDIDLKEYLTFLVKRTMTKDMEEGKKNLVEMINLFSSMKAFETTKKHFGEEISNDLKEFREKLGKLKGKEGDIEEILKRIKKLNQEN